MSTFSESLAYDFLNVDFRMWERNRKQRRLTDEYTGVFFAGADFISVDNVAAQQRLAEHTLPNSPARPGPANFGPARPIRVH